jgi:uncharacterized protein (TIRG00374 family)
MTAALIFALYKFVPYSQLSHIYKTSIKFSLFFAFFLYACGITLGILRWRILLACLGIHIPWCESFCAYLSGLFFNLFFPSFVAGDVFRGAGISYRYGETQKVFSSVLLDRYSGGIALNCIALVSFLTGWKMFFHWQIFYALMIFTAASFFVTMLIMSKSFFAFWMNILKKGSKLRKKLVDFHDQLYFFRERPKAFFRTFFISLFIQTFTCLLFYFVACAFRQNISVLYFFIVVPIIMVIAIMPITIAGIGTREFAAIYFLSLIGVQRSVALSISLVNLTCMVGSGILGGIVYVSVYHRWLQSRT